MSSDLDINEWSELDGYGPPDVRIEKPPGMEIPPNPLRTRPTEHPLPRHLHESGSLQTELDPSLVELIEQLNNGFHEGAPSGVYRVRVVGIGERVLKVFHGVQTDPRLRGFIREAKAYHALFTRGVCATGSVPKYYGWVVMDRTRWNIPGQHDWLRPFNGDPEDPRALIMEYLPNASRMTLRMATRKTLQNSMASLAVIHRAGVLHSDIHPRNILVLPDKRVVWIDFEMGSRSLRDPELFDSELCLAWCWLYEKMLPWKWYALRKAYDQSERPDDKAELDDIQRLLVDHGAKFNV